MKKRKYIAPETELIRFSDEGCQLLKETRGQIGNGSGDGYSFDIEEGDLDTENREEVAAKHFQGWEDVGSNVKWEDE